MTKCGTALLVLATAVIIGTHQATRGLEVTSKLDWPTATPEEVGLDSAALSEMFHFVRERNLPVHSAQIVRQGRLVLDAFFYPYRADMRHDVASVTKSINSTLIGLAIDKGHLRDVNQSLVSLFADRTVAALDERKRKLTLEHLLTMQAGWDCASDALLAPMRRRADWVQYALDLPMIAEPGQRFAYCSVNCHLTSALITRSTGTNALGFARRELFEPLGIRDVAWPIDPHGHNHGWGDLQMHPRDMLKIGQLMVQRGRWGDRQLVPEAWIRASTRAHVGDTGNGDAYGYYWWVKTDQFPGMFEAVGRGGQRITIWPAKDLVIVFTGGGFEPADLGKFILKALKSDDKLPANPEVFRQLGKRIADATNPPPPRPFPKPPPLAERISGKTFTLSANTLGATALTLHFDDSAEARAELLWVGHRECFGVGLDTVQRFSTNTILNLPCAAKGQWLGNETFLLELDLVGGINHYRFTLAFGDQGRKLNVTLRERTGLNDEQFTGTSLP